MEYLYIEVWETTPSMKKKAPTTNYFSYLFTFVSVVIVAWALAYGWDNQGKLAARIDRLENDNVLQQTMIKRIDGTLKDLIK